MRLPIASWAWAGIVFALVPGVLGGCSGSRFCEAQGQRSNCQFFSECDWQSNFHGDDDDSSTNTNGQGHGVNVGNAGMIVLLGLAGLVLYFVALARVANSQDSFPVEPLRMIVIAPAFYMVFFTLFGLVVGEKEAYVFFLEGGIAFCHLLLAMASLPAVPMSLKSLYTMITDRESRPPREPLFFLFGFCTFLSFWPTCFCFLVLGFILAACYLAIELTKYCGGIIGAYAGHIGEVQWEGQARRTGVGRVILALLLGVCFTILFTVQFTIDVNILRVAEGAFSRYVPFSAELRTIYQKNMMIPGVPQVASKVGHVASPASHFGSAIVGSIKNLPNFVMDSIDDWSLLRLESLFTFQFFTFLVLVVLANSDMVTMVMTSSAGGAHGRGALSKAWGRGLVHAVKAITAIGSSCLISHGFLYLVQALVSACNRFALEFFAKILGSHDQLVSADDDSKAFFREMPTYLGTYLTFCAFTIALLFYAVFTVRTLCGVDVFGLKNKFQKLIGHGKTREGQPCTTGWMGPLLGVWDEGALNCFEAKERSEEWQTSVPMILRATTFSLTLCLMAFPGGALIAKMGESANKVPWRVEGFETSPKQRILYVLHMVEFVMLAVVSSAPALSEAMGGIPLVAAQVLIVLRAFELSIGIAFQAVGARELANSAPATRCTSIVPLLEA